MKQTVLVCILATSIFLILAPVVSSTINESENNDLFKDISEGKALLAQIYIELDRTSEQAKLIIENYDQNIPGMLTDIDIFSPDANRDNDHDLMIAPLIRTLIGQQIGIGPYFKPVIPNGATVVNIKMFWGSIQYDTPCIDEDMMIIDGWAPLISWEYKIN
jgi:hypothetical protein